MTNVLISGSRSIQSLPHDAIASIDRIIALGFDIIIGDANGIDCLVQKYLKQQNYQRVTVYYASFSGSGKPRNNGGFLIVSVPGNYSDRDKAMCELADYGLAIWDGRSKGTKANIDRVLKTKIIRI